MQSSCTSCLLLRVALMLLRSGIPSRQLTWDRVAQVLWVCTWQGRLYLIRTEAVVSAMASGLLSGLSLGTPV